MGQCFLYGNGGGLSNLRLQIYGGLTAPTNPKEHTIWVKTGTPITQWILTQKPTAWAETAGSVDIVYEASCSYNFSDAEIAVYNGKLNGIYGQWWMRLTDCYQSDGSTLKSVDAYVYINGSWVQFSPGWHGELFENGNQYKSVTGGWVGNNQTEIGATLKLKVANSRPIVSTAKPINLAGFTKLHCIADTAYGYFGVAAIQNINASSPNWVVNGSIGTSDTVLDISSVQFGYIQCFAVASWAVTINVTQMWLE